MSPLYFISSLLENSVNREFPQIPHHHVVEINLLFTVCKIELELWLDKFSICKIAMYIQHYFISFYITNVTLSYIYIIYSNLVAHSLNQRKRVLLQRVEPTKWIWTSDLVNWLNIPNTCSMKKGKQKRVTYWHMMIVILSTSETRWGHQCETSLFYAYLKQWTTAVMVRYSDRSRVTVVGLSIPSRVTVQSGAWPATLPGGPCNGTYSLWWDT